MDNLKGIALLIDADNTQLSKIEAVIREVSAYGRIVVKRAYGNWKKQSLGNWEDELKRLAIRAQQQFDYVSGKNTTDMALTIDAMRLLHSGGYDAFVIVSSDSDFTPLAITLHESGAYIMGVGAKQTPEPFRNSCDEFIFLENLDNEPAEEKNAQPDDIKQIHSLLKSASKRLQDDDGWVQVGDVGNFIKRAKPDFDVRTYGYPKLSKLISAFPDRYEMKRVEEKDHSIVLSYRCRYGR